MVQEYDDVTIDVNLHFEGTAHFSDKLEQQWKIHQI